MRRATTWCYAVGADGDQVATSRPAVDRQVEEGVDSRAPQDPIRRHSARSITGPDPDQPTGPLSDAYRSRPRRRRFCLSRNQKQDL